MISNYAKSTFDLMGYCKNSVDLLWGKKET